jgi:hypothetical protein
MPFVKLDCGILQSSLWFDKDTRDVFLTALLLAVPHETKTPTPQLETDSLNETGWSVPPGRYGFVKASGPGICHTALVDKKSGLTALATLASPEAESRSQAFDGRRLIRVDGGFIVLNYAKYRDLDGTAAERSARYRQSHRNGVASRRDDRDESRDVTQAEAEGEADQELWGSNKIEDQHNTEVRTGADRAREAKPPTADLAVWNPNGRAAHTPNSLAANRHLRCHPAGMAACQRGICIPAFLVQQWHSQLDPDQASPANAEQAVRTFIAAVLSGLSPGPIGDDPLKFWRAQWEHAHGAQAPAAKSGKLSAVKETQANAKIALEALRNRRDANGQRRTGPETHPLAHTPANRHAVAKT